MPAARWWLSAGLAALAAFTSFLSASPESATSAGGPQTALHPALVEIQPHLLNRLNNHPGLGIVVGLVDATGKRWVVAAGKAGENRKQPLAGDTVFEIGSMTKVFTSALLAEMAGRGEVALDDPVAKYLPATVRVPARGGRQITLGDLATHTSGLPRLPGNMNPRDPDNPYADYTVEQLYGFLSSYTLTRDVGAQYEYSNLGAGLLGHALSRRAGTTYERIVTERLLTPLGMRSTCITLTPALQARFAVGHTSLGYPTEPWDLTTLAGAGALRSTLDDMLAFVQANMTPPGDRLGKALATMHAFRHDAGPAQPGRPELSVALGWHLRKTADGQLVWHNGGTYGFHSFMGFDPKKRLGVVVLHNGGGSVDDIGFHLLDPTIALDTAKAAVPARTEVAVAPDLLAKYAGEYVLFPAVMTVTTDGDILCIQMTGQAKVRVYPESETKFFLKIADAQVTFTSDDSGAVTGVVLHQNGRDVPGKRR